MLVRAKPMPAIEVTAKSRRPSEVTVDVTGLTAEGLGQAAVDGRALQIRNALPGEQVTARILKRRKGIRFAECAAGLPIENPHPDRRPSACGYFPRCGGCNLHHLAYPAQLALKQQQLADALTAQQVTPRAWSTAQSITRLGYRRKARLGVRQVGEQVLVGFRESFSNRVAKLDACMTLTARLSALIQPLKALLPQLSVADKVPQIEVAQGDEDCALIVRHLEPFTARDLTLWQAFERTHDVQVLLQSGGYDSLATLRDGPVIPLGYQLPEWGIYMTFLPHQFTQVNLDMNKALIRHALAYLGDLHGRKVLDLFCGIGNFSLPLARAGARVMGVEAAADAVAMATQNARLNQLQSAIEFRVADLYNPDADHAALLTGYDALLLDPPRSGAGEHLPAWLNGFSGSQVVYVSCNPVSFAKDAAVLSEQGFVLDTVGIFDMFPHTAHVETVGHFVRQN